MLNLLDANLSFSPEDHAILEEEYAKNAKPEKAARMAIVSRVALGEKEVQVSSAIPPRSALSASAELGSHNPISRCCQR